MCSSMSYQSPHWPSLGVRIACITNAAAQHVAAPHIAALEHAPLAFEVHANIAALANVGDQHALLDALAAEEAFLGRRRR